MTMYSLPFLCLLLALVLVLPVSHGGPVYREGENRPLAAVTDLSSRLATHSQHLQARQEPRLPLLTPPDLETIKKVAQILIMLGEQVIPAVIGETPSNNSELTEYSLNDVSTKNKLSVNFQMPHVSRRKLL
ncbi:uncharacterized protein ACR2FA_010184 [Aphomia sociella]